MPLAGQPESEKMPSPGRATTTGRRGCFTTALVDRGRVARVERHVERLRRDAARLGLELPDPADIARLLSESARGAFGPESDGIVRIEWSGDVGERLRLRASVRPLDPRPSCWRARTAETRHPGPEQRSNAKQLGVWAYEQARAEAAVAAHAEEVLLFDAEGRVVEGSHTNLLIVTAAGDLRTPDPSLGPVEGIGLAIVRESTPALQSAWIDRMALRAARELMAVNVVRGVVPIVEIDGMPVAAGEPGVWARRLQRLFREP